MTHSINPKQFIFFQRVPVVKPSNRFPLLKVNTNIPQMFNFRHVSRHQPRLPTKPTHTKTPRKIPLTFGLHRAVHITFFSQKVDSSPWSLMISVEDLIPLRHEVHSPAHLDGVSNAV